MVGKVKGNRRGRTDRSRISSKHQVTIPVDVLRRAGLAEGDVVRFECEPGGTVRITKVNDPAEALIGSMPGLSAAFDLDADRESWHG